MFPFKSVTVSVTVLTPTFAHVNAFGDALSDAMPQLSKLPPSISEATIVAFPELSRNTVIDWHIAVGGTVSPTTNNVCAPLLPQLSLAVTLIIPFDVPTVTVIDVVVDEPFHPPGIVHV
jgi:hypothetical protein